MTVTNRAYSVLQIKSISEDKRIIRGIATTPTTDRMGDIVESTGVSFKNPMPLLWQHQHDKPVGFVKFDKPTKDGITFEAELPQIAEAGTLRDRIEEAWQSVKSGLVSAVSIGFRAVEYAFLDEGGIRFTKSEVFELSLVTIPANAEAVITAKNFDAEAAAVIKSFDTDAPATTDIQQAEAPAATGKKVRVVKLKDSARDRAKPFIIRSIRRN
jgi:HK97 family phage prohead protease